MLPKKSKKADLENRKGIFLQIGLIMALAIILVSFEWSSKPQGDNETLQVQGIVIEDEMLLIERQQPPKEQPKPELPSVAEVLDIVEDDIVLDPVVFNTEVDENTIVDFTMYDPGEEDDVQEQIPFILVQDKPTFNGGNPEVEFRKYIYENIDYPDIAAQNGIGGKVIVQFCVDQRGKVVDVRIARSADPALDDEALRVVRASPQWTPGKQRGQPVKVFFTFPINFTLQ